MALMTSYLLKTSNLAEFFAAIQSAKAPERFSYKFLKDLDFTSSNDRLLIAVLKGLGFVDETGVPQQRYFDFLDQSNAGRVLAGAIEEAYSDLFQLRRDAQNMPVDEVRGKFRSLTQGQKSENVVSNMATTFAALSEQADWSKPAPLPGDGGGPEEEEDSSVQPAPTLDEVLTQSADVPRVKKLELHYNIQLVLPASRDPAVFDALFASLKRHLL